MVHHAAASAAAALFDATKQTPTLGRFLQGQIGGAEVCEVILPLSRHRNIEARGKHDESSRTSVVVVFVCTLVETQSYLWLLRPPAH
jgi:hypothetical protein